MATPETMPAADTVAMAAEALAHVPLAAVSAKVMVVPVQMKVGPVTGGT